MKLLYFALTVFWSVDGWLHLTEIIDGAGDAYDGVFVTLAVVFILYNGWVLAIRPPKREASRG